MLGVTLICEVILLGAMSFAVLFSGGGPDGLVPEAVNPVNAFKSLPAGGGMGIEGIAAGSAAIGLFFAFWSWVGFETTAAYGEESRNPKSIIPKATLIAVVALGLFYTFCSWMMIAGNGKATAIELSAAGDLNLWVGLAQDKLGGKFVGDIYVFLIIMGSFACALAFHTAASRYLYAIGRELPFAAGTLGRTHETHGTPHVASMVQSGITLVLTLGFYFLGKDGKDTLTGAYIYQYGLLAILGTMAILIVQAICSFAVIYYFHVKKEHPGNGITTGVIPFLGGIGHALRRLPAHRQPEVRRRSRGRLAVLQGDPLDRRPHLRRRPGLRAHPARDQPGALRQGRPHGDGGGAGARVTRPDPGADHASSRTPPGTHAASPTRSAAWLPWSASGPARSVRPGPSTASPAG